jgi:hypothetical protein
MRPVRAAARDPGPLSLPVYRIYGLSRLAATLAAQIQVVAIGWQMYALTGSVLDLGLVGLVQLLPSVLLLFVVGLMAAAGAGGASCRASKH